MVTGGRTLNGNVKIPAAKISVLPLFAASLLCTGEVRLQAVPRLADVEHCMALLRGVGCAARWEGSDAVLSGPPANSTLPGQTAGQMRASILFCAPLLARLGRAETSLPGGCRIGARPIDLHLAGLAEMGAVELEAGEGRLVLTGWPERAERLIGDGTAVTELVYRDRRYGVLSQVLVRDRYSGQTETVSDGEFIAQGGMARRVMTMPGRSNFQTMRYTGKFQLERAKGERIRLEVEIGEAFSAWPGELVRVQRSGWDRNGLYRVAQSTVGMDSRGYWTRLELAPPDFVV